VETGLGVGAGTSLVTDGDDGAGGNGDAAGVADGKMGTPGTVKDGSDIGGVGVVSRSAFSNVGVSTGFTLGDVLSLQFDDTF